jgi:hypothetical protein
MSEPTAAECNKAIAVAREQLQKYRPESMRLQATVRLVIAALEREHPDPSEDES